MAKDYLYSVAEIYAQAVYELAEQQDLLQVVNDDLETICECVVSDKDFEHFLASPSISENDKTALLIKVFDGKVDGLTMDFLKVLSARDRLETIVYINKAYKTMLDKANGRVDGILTTAIQLTSEEINTITKSIGQSLGKNVKLNITVNPEIIGGMQLQIGNMSIDGSIRKQLAEFAAKLSSHQPGITAISEE